MASLNKYGSITQTFLSSPILAIDPLSSKATPPADLNIVPADFAGAKELWSGKVVFEYKQFRLGDIPRIVGVGIWCNLADGLVQIDSPDDIGTGLIVGIGGKSYNGANVLQQANILVPNPRFKVQEFNTIEETDILLSDFMVLDYTLTGYPSLSGSAGYYILNAYLDATTMDFSMISIDPAYAGQPLYMRPMVVIEHTYPLFQ
jgi:hypothetical protein